MAPIINFSLVPAASPHGASCEWPGDPMAPTLAPSVANTNTQAPRPEDTLGIIFASLLSSPVFLLFSSHDAAGCCKLTYI